MQKQKRNQLVKFLHVFTFDELKKENPSIIDITLRYKIEQAENRGSIEKIGKVKIDIGRPKNVYIKLPMTKETIKELTRRNVILNRELKTEE